MATYKIKDEWLRKEDNGYTTVNGRLVALIREGVKQSKAGKDGPEKTVKVPLATQDDLKWLHESGHPWVEKEETPTATKQLAEKQ